MARKIEKGIPKPGSGGGGSLDERLKELKGMSIGDSFKLAASEKNLVRSDVNRLHNQEGQTKRWSVHQLNEKEYRCWRDK